MSVTFRPSEPASVLSTREEVTMHTIAPGWYPDAQGTTRWWDGQAWTQHVAMHPSAHAMPPTIIVHQDRGKPVNHVLHAVLSVVTVGLWLPVWLIVAIAKN